MALLELKKSKTVDNQIAKKSKVSKQVKQAGGISGAISQMVAHANSKLSKYKDKYIILTETEEIQNYINICITDKYVAIDTETTGLDVFTVDIVGICLYSKSNKPAYIPLNHKSYITGEKVSNQANFEDVKNILNKCNSKIKWIMHNADFDIRIFRHTMGIYLKCYHDTLIGAKMLDENLLSYGLKNLHIDFCKSEDIESLTFDSLFSGITFDNIPISTAYLYASGDALKTFELFEYQKNEFEKVGNEKFYKVFKEIEMPIVEVVCDMEDAGFTIDFEIVNRLSVKYNKLKDSALENAYNVISNYENQIKIYKSKNINHKLSDPINILSPTQLSILLYDILKLPQNGHTRGTGIDVLQEFANNNMEIDLINSILEVRKYEKLIGTYIDTIPKLAERDGKVHCRFNQLGAKTGRFSSNSPNMQNLPSHNKEVRQMFKADSGYSLISADYSKQEIFIAASVSEDINFIKSCKKSLINDTDIYSEIASMIYDMPYEDCVEFNKDGSKNSNGKERRGNAKNIVLAILYSKGIPSIATDLNVSVEKAQQIYNGVLKAFPKLEETIHYSQKMAKEVGYVETAWGTRRHLPDMQLPLYEFELVDGVSIDFNPMEFTHEEISNEVPKHIQQDLTNKLKKCYGRDKKNIIKSNALKNGIKIKDNGGFIAQAERQCLNSRIQGSASNIIKVAMILIHQDKELKNLGLRLLLTIHDELIAEVPTENIEKATKRMNFLMCEAGKGVISVPMKVDFEITKNWNEVK